MAIQTTAKLRPLGSRVVIKAQDREEVTKSGIVLPDTAKEKPQRGAVVAVGPGEWNIATGKRVPVDLTPGDQILFEKYAGTEFKIDDEDLLIFAAKDILAIVES